MYAHRWMAPQVVRLPSGTFTARQECFDCGTRRNPITRKLTRRRRGCWTDELEGVRQNLGRLPRVREELAQLERVGEDVDPFHPEAGQLSSLPL